MKTTHVVAAALVGGLASTLASAGTEFEATCSKENCRFQVTVRVGGGLGGDSVQGLCKKCGKAVLIAWTPRNKHQKPEPVAEFWDPQTGEIRQLFRCPECRTPFVAIKDIQDLRHCPKCNQPSLKYRPTAQYSSVRTPDQ
jgi:hypothetical protein